MKRNLLAVGILVAILAFLALPDGQAGGAKPTNRWKANVSGANILVPVDFVGGVDHVNIFNGPVACGNGTGSYIELQAFVPSLRFFNMVGFFQWGNTNEPASAPLDLAPYGFPGTTTIWPLSVQDFLNNNLHPTDDYPHIIWRFSTCGCENPTTDLLTMPVGTSIPVRMSLLFFSHIWGCPPDQNTLLNLNMVAHGYFNPVLGDYDVKIVRNTLTKWTVVVDTVFGNPGFPPPSSSFSANWPSTTNDGIMGQYATCESGPVKKGRPTWTTTYHYPWAKAPLKLQITFEKY